MSTVTFETLKASRHLQAAGIAEAIVGSMGEAFSGTVAYKADIAALEASTKADIANLKAGIFRALWMQGPGIIGRIVGLTRLLYPPRYRWGRC